MRGSGLISKLTSLTIENLQFWLLHSTLLEEPSILICQQVDFGFSYTDLSVNVRLILFKGFPGNVESNVLILIEL